MGKNRKETAHINWTSSQINHPLRKQDRNLSPAGKYYSERRTCREKFKPLPCIIHLPRHCDGVCTNFWAPYWRGSSLVNLTIAQCFTSFRANVALRPTRASVNFIASESLTQYTFIFLIPTRYMFKVERGRRRLRVSNHWHRSDCYLYYVVQQCHFHFYLVPYSVTPTFECRLGCDLILSTYCFSYTIQFSYYLCLYFVINWQGCQIMTK